jgi:DNA-binding GntR family transcriptional regulator
MKIEKAYRYVKRQIIDGVWKPDTAINVNEISALLNISRTPINKALAKLEQEGFLSIIPQVGVFVKRPDPHDVLERLLVCANLDALMTEQAALKIKEEELAYMESLLTKMDNPDLSYDEYSSLNIEFHRAIYQASELTYTFNLAKQLWDYLNYVGNPDFLFSKERRKKSQTEHWMIYYSLKQKDSQMAKKLMEKHLHGVAASMIDTYKDITSDLGVFN